MKDFIKYLSVSDQEKNWGFYVTTAGYRRVQPKEIYPNAQQHPLTHSFTWDQGRVLDGYYLVFISNGQGVFETAKTGSHRVSAGTVFFLFPGVWHRYKPDENAGWEEYWVGFQGNYPEALMSKSFFNPEQPFIHIGPNEYFLQLLHQLIEIIESGKTGFHQIISGIALQILGMLHAASQTESDTETADSLILKAKFLLQESIMEKINMQQLARELPMGYSSFRKIFKTETGQSPNQYLLDIRLKKAKDLLKSTDMNINEIAYRSGFLSIYHFSKLFKKKNKVSPVFYRKQGGNMEYGMSG